MALNRGFAYRAQIGPEAAGRRVGAWLAATYAHSSAADWAARLAARGRSRSTTPSLLATRRCAPDRSWSGSVRRGTNPTCRSPSTSIHEDADLLAVSKPSGLPTMPAGGFLDHTLLALVRARFGDAHPAHRLGRGTSGLVLFARTPRGRRRTRPRLAHAGGDEDLSRAGGGRSAVDLVRHHDADRPGAARRCWARCMRRAPTAAPRTASPPSSSAATAPRCVRSASRPDGRIRSGSTWRRPDIRSPAIRCMSPADDRGRRRARCPATAATCCTRTACGWPIRRPDGHWISVAPPPPALRTAGESAS